MLVTDLASGTLFNELFQRRIMVVPLAVNEYGIGSNPVAGANMTLRMLEFLSRL